ncbi:MAG: ISAzo13 family transposase, partial [Deltaproteobacteria bacterium]|nr:ISAzo13 family transposase [Deltaproteobacteria bacterium]
MDIETEIAVRFKQLSPHLDERGLRLFVAAEANAIGRGGVTLLHRITGVARSTIKRGQDELA